MRRREALRTWGLGLASCLLLLGLAAPARAVEVEARLARPRVMVGEVATLVVIIRDAGVGAGDPEFTLPDGLELLSHGRSQNFTAVNGRNSLDIVHRFEIGVNAAGHFGIGPIAVRAGSEIFRSGLLTLDASAAATHLSGGGSGSAASGAPASTGAAALIVDVLPPSPWQGQPCVLRVRLVQRASLAEDPQYTPPATPGFWTDKQSQPESYYADERRQRVLVTETRTRLYPLAAGVATIGEAEANLALVTGADDPGTWVGGKVPRREVVVRSRPVQVRVRALPAAAPAGFGGAVGNLSAHWSTDRTRTTVDVPITVWLDVRGVGNLPLVRPPALRAEEIEVFASAVDDSLPSGPGDAMGRRRFQWTVLAKRPGPLTLVPPPFAWFDPSAGAYRRSDGAAIAIDVGPALFGGGGAAGLPAPLAEHPADPGARPALPWAWSLAALLVAAAIALWRRAAAPLASAPERARALEWLRAVGRTSGPDFWRAADEACAWLESQGKPVSDVRRAIAAARFAGERANPEPFRRRLVEQISAALPPAPASGSLRLVAIVLAAVAMVVCVVSGPRGGDERGRAEARAADQAARDGDMNRARATWQRLWREGSHAPALAARLAWAEAQSGAAGAAAAWVVRGEQQGGRDPALSWVGERVREGGGLVGVPSPRWPVRALEWGIAALLFGIAAGRLWPRRRLAAAAAALVVVCGLIDPLQALLADRADRGVILGPVALADAESAVDLQPGRVVHVREQSGDRVRIDAGAGVVGWIPAGSIDIASTAR
jgi:hypothetical protein